MLPTPPHPLRIHAEPLAAAVEVPALLAALQEHAGPAVLDSAAAHPAYGRFSVFACEPMEVLTLDARTLRDGDGRILTTLPETPGPAEEFWAALSGRLSQVRAHWTPPPLAEQVGYAPGWIGYVGYEVGRTIERLPGRTPRDLPLPDLRLAFHEAILVYAHPQRQWWLVRLEDESGRPFGPGRGEAALRAAWQAAQSHPPRVPPEKAVCAADRHDDPRATALAAATSPFTPEQYRRTVARCVDYIAAGDIFQVNLSQRFAVAGAADPASLYDALRRRNPAWYAALLRFDTQAGPAAVLSSSPELFLRVRGRHVTTRPIKGTRPRTGDDGADRAAMADLLASAKDNAELAMIIDLLRNDLGRVCRFGSVRVTEPRVLETHPTVFHLVGTVEGQLREEVDTAELLRATFPGGSITGAPKIRAMQIIDDLEPHARGPYTGCIGHVGVDGSCEWNIAIRTVVHVNATAYVQVGGGIVADSDPESEYQETLAKARALREAAARAGQAPEATPTARRRG